MTLGTWVGFGWVGMITIGLFLCLAYISANKRDIDTKLSAYNPWGVPSTSRMSWMTLGTWVSLNPTGQNENELHLPLISSIVYFHSGRLPFTTKSL